MSSINLPAPETLALRDRINLLCDTVPFLINSMQALKVDGNSLLTRQPPVTWLDAVALLTDVALLQKDIEHVQTYMRRAEQDLLFQFSVTIRIFNTMSYHHLTGPDGNYMLEDITESLLPLYSYVMKWVIQSLYYLFDFRDVLAHVIGRVRD
ncbi:hypothetical protein RUND412_004967 [Rhizina undulata]